MPKVTRNELETMRRLVNDIMDGAKKVKAGRATARDVKNLEDDAFDIFRVLDAVWQRPD